MLLVAQYNEIHVMSGTRKEEVHVSSAATCRMKCLKTSTVGPTRHISSYFTVRLS